MTELVSTRRAQRKVAILGEPVVDPAAWTGADLASDQSWRYDLAPRDIDSLMVMARAVRARIGTDADRLMQLPKDAFALGAFAQTLEHVREQLRDGLGVALLRGLPIDDMDRIDAAAIYWAIGRHLGQPRSNNPEGDMIGHVTDLGKTQADPRSRGYQTRETMDYHCDMSSVVGLLCVRPARSGGLSKIASSVSVYNELLKRSPEAIEVLSAPLCWTKHGEVDPGEPGFYRSPVFAVLDGKLCTAFGPKHIVKGHSVEGAPPLTEPQRRAVELAESLAEELHYAMELECGDIQLLNNFVTLHTRTAYVDWPVPEKKRLLWRLWLDTPDMRPPTDYVKQWASGVQLRSTRPRIVL